MTEILKALNIDPVLLVLNIVLFLSLLVILNFMFWKPMMRQLDKRKQSIEDAHKEVERTQREMESLRDEYRVNLAKIENDARARIQQAVHEAQQERERILTEARAQSDEIKRQGEESIRAESNEAMRQMVSTLDQLSLQTLDSILGAGGGGGKMTLVREYIANQAARSNSENN